MTSSASTFSPASPGSTPLRRALISLTNKEGAVAFARALVEEFGVEVLSTGGTAATLRAAGIPVTEVSDYTGFPELLDGRVKTLHPRIHAGILARRDVPAHLAALEQARIAPIDLVCVNLYAFEEAAAAPGCTFQDAVEHIDIGGPCLLRAAAKNHASVTVVSNPAQYQQVLAAMRANAGATTPELRLSLARAAFATTAAYDAAIATWLAAHEPGPAGEAVACEAPVSAATASAEKNLEVASAPATNVAPAASSSKSATASSSFSAASGAPAPSEDAAASSPFQPTLTLNYVKARDLRYGENPHQAAALYVPAATGVTPPAPSLATSELLGGKPLSYNNLIDADAAWACVCDLPAPAVVILKHQNPCGSAVAATVEEAYARAYACDPVSAYGGIVAANAPVTLAFAQELASVNKHFVEVLIAPAFEPAALERLQRRKNLRLVQTGTTTRGDALELRTIDGGLLAQELDHLGENARAAQVLARRAPTPREWDDLDFAWRVVKTVKSNAILVARDGCGVGMGPGQPNRVDSARLAAERAHEACARMALPTSGLVAASDAFFPFADGIFALAQAGITAIIEPGGSVRDSEVVDACNQCDIALVATGVRHFRH
jgi:phosphoribosylaminoimidazolecarboxamide formyltransferase/IMP cyclohydrolase